MRKAWLLIVLLISTAIVVPIIDLMQTREHDSSKPFFGVSFGLKTVADAKLLIDKVKADTNFFLVDSWDLCTNETALTEVCDYAANAGLSFIVFFDYIAIPGIQNYPWHVDWISNAKQRWGDKFLGIYIYEEPGGKQIDTGLFDEIHNTDIFENASSYSQAANIFVNELSNAWSFSFLSNESIPKFTSDYALHWFDYSAGYDVIFAELGMNLSTDQQIGSCRGAAKAYGRDWGTIITWKETNPPVFKNGTEMLQDCITSYEAGADYIIVFNFPQYPEDNPYGILADEHFAAIKKFWEYMSNHPEDYGKTDGEIAFVLPKDYGWGMRSPTDKMWGLWLADNDSTLIWDNLQLLIDRYGLKIDIIYENAPSNCIVNYTELYCWNATIT
jgi:hypothetical protein